MRAVHVPAEGDPVEIDLPDDDSPAMIRRLAELVGGRIEALSLPDREDVTIWGNDEAKLISRTVDCYDCRGTGKDPSDDDTCPTCNGRGTITVDGLPENNRATLLIYGDKDQARQRGAEAIAAYREMGFEVITATGDDPREPFVAGDVVVVGNDPRTGASRPCPDPVVDLLLDR